MRYVRIGLLIIFGAALLVVPNGIRLSASDGDVVQQAKDEHEIKALMWKYARALDTLNADAYVSCYTPDGQFIAGPNPTAGADALRKMIADLKTRRDEQIKKGETPAPMYHMDMNAYVEFTSKDHARHHTYWQTVFGAVGRGGQVRVAAAGNAVDDLVKVNGKWLIKVRNVSPGTTD
ncbi:MAG TPA: nuclear transport factor 2 family protein [Vicinamibacterales bacterium]|nr:nuclear transport factor 2 family protein [Vicinamibacterales bacterium]